MLRSVWCAQQRVLTIVTYDIDNNGTYVNNLWVEDHNFGGDAINIFNGEVNTELNHIWPFFDVESLSSTKELKIGEHMIHTQSIYHIEGRLNQLEPIALQLLGTSLKVLPFLKSHASISITKYHMGY